MAGEHMHHASSILGQRSVSCHQSQTYQQSCPGIAITAPWATKTILAAALEAENFKPLIAVCTDRKEVK